MTEDPMVWDNRCTLDENYETVADYIAARCFRSPEEQIDRWAEVDWFPGGMGSTLLDVPCGNASYYDLFVEYYGFEYIGCDASHRMIELASTAHPGVPFVIGRVPSDVGDETRLPFQDGEVDIVFCTDVMQHLAATEPALAELARIARQWVVVHQRAMLQGPPTRWQTHRGRHGEIVRIERLEEVRRSMFGFCPDASEHLMWEFEISDSEHGDRRVVEAYYVMPRVSGNAVA